MSSRNIRRSARLHRASSPAKDFPLFVKLPTELRIMIWEHALRCQETPAVHFFSLTLPYRDLHDDQPHDVAKSLWHLLEPPDDKTSPKMYRNTSAYMIDMGLWTACRESRAIIHRHWEGKLVTPLVRHSIPMGNGVYFMPMNPYYDGNDAKNGAAAVAWTQPRADGSSGKLMLFPTKDLFCLTNPPRQGLSAIEDAWFDIDSMSPERRPGFKGLANLALPYPREWDKLWLNDDYDELDPVYTHIFSVHGPRKLWFIDYRIKISHKKLELIEQKGGSIFHGMGMRLAEVRDSLCEDHQPWHTQHGLKALNTIEFLSDLLLDELMDLTEHERNHCVREIGLLGVVVDG